MLSTKVVLLQLLWVSLASASHFYGGVVTYTATSIGNGRFMVEMRNKATFHGCQYQFGTCRHWGTCGHDSQIEAGIIDSSPNSATSGHWCQTETVVTKILTTDKPFQTWESSCCWIYLDTIYISPAWSVLTKVVLGTRSDTNAPNNSPATGIIPFLRVPQNCRRSYRPLLIDPEGDVVRCRYGNRNANECDDCRRQVGFTLNQGTCRLQYLGSGSQGIRGFELVVEDFPRKSMVLTYSDGSQFILFGKSARKKRWAMPMTTPWWWWVNATTPASKNFTIAPTTTTTTTTTNTSWWWLQSTTPAPVTSDTFSVLPLQFVFKVDPPAPSCVEGVYLPKLVPPTPRDREVIQAGVGQEVEILVKAQAQNTRADHIIMTGPLNITKHKLTGDVFAIRWTPTEDDLGHYFPICFVVEFTNGSTIYQSEMRCVVVDVTTAVVNTVVTCKESSIIVEVEKATLSLIHYNRLRLSDPSDTVCKINSNSTHWFAKIPLNKCGTQLDDTDGENLLFRNEITTVDSNTTVVTRRHQVEIKFECQYAKEGNVTLSFSAHRDKVTVWDKGLGTFTYDFEFFPDQNFGTRYDPRLYPLEYDVGDRIYMEIDATTTMDNTELFLLSCIATPYDIPNYKTTYPIIENGCNKDSTIIVHTVPNKRMFRFSIEAFKFLGLHDQVFISCTVLMCEAGNSQTRCSRGCQPHGPSRSRREAVIESGTHYVSQGPLRIKRSLEAAGSTGLNLNLNLVFITGCALAAVGMICGVVFYKARRSSVKYRPLPLEDH